MRTLTQSHSPTCRCARCRQAKALPSLIQKMGEATSETYADFEVEPFVSFDTAAESPTWMRNELVDEQEAEYGRRRQPPRRGLQPRVRPAARPVRRQPQGRQPRLVRRGPAIFASGPAVIEAPPPSDTQGSEYIRWVQNKLNQLLALNLPVDGVMGMETRSAIRSFQERQGLPVDGIVGPETERALSALRDGKPLEPDGAPPASEFDFEWEGEVNRSSRDYVQWVQRSLNKILGLQLAEDGLIGPMTRSAIRSFQQQKGLSPDGIVGPITEAALIAAGAGNPPSSGAPSYIPPYPPVRPPTTTPTGSLAFITISSNVIMNAAIDRVVHELDSYFRQANLKVRLTSAVRTAEQQLNIIKNAARKYKVDQKYPSIKTATVDNKESWIDTWDELLNRKGYIVNPPKPVTSRISGRPYDISPHMKGEAFDLSGADLDRIASVVQSYCQQGGAIRQILIERVNNAVHVGIGSGGACAIT